jgi:hypothetical protein
MDILYHYCSTASFHAITQSHALWLSSLSLSNDTMEGKLVARAIARLAEKDSLESNGFRLLRRIIVFLELAFDGLGFCLSEEDDLLSQWRGYAADATGVSIGFSKEYLKRLAKRNGCLLGRVKYDPSAHEARIEPTYRELTQLIKDGTLKPDRGLGIIQTAGMTDQQKAAAAMANLGEELLKLGPKLLPLFYQLYLLKSPAFREEQEWRVLSMLTTDGEDEDACSHRIADNRIVPYREVELVELERSPIVEVILGPKHGTPPKIVENFLKLNGYGLVKVTRSEASYR